MAGMLAVPPVLALTMVSCAVVACGGTSHPPDAAPHDASTIDAMADADTTVFQDLMLGPVEVDIFVSVDNSASMFEEQQLLSAAGSSFYTRLLVGGLDVHLGILKGSSDDPRGELVGVPPTIESTQADPIGTFESRVDMGTNGNANCESALTAFDFAMNEPNLGGANAGFLRQDAALALIALSDEDDQADVLDCGTPGSAPAPFAASITEHKDGLERVVFAAIAGFDTDDNSTPQDCDGPSGGATAGEAYSQAASLLNGTSLSVCSDEYSSYLTAVADEIIGATRFGSIHLAETPISDSLKIWVDRNDENGLVPLDKDDPSTPWTYDSDANTINFQRRAYPQFDWSLQAEFLPR